MVGRVGEVFGVTVAVVAVAVAVTVAVGVVDVHREDTGVFDRLASDGVEIAEAVTGIGEIGDGLPDREGLPGGLGVLTPGGERREIQGRGGIAVPRIIRISRDRLLRARRRCRTVEVIVQVIGGAGGVVSLVVGGREPLPGAVSRAGAVAAGGAARGVTRGSGT
ncbi:hypothetical protein Q7689_13630, partial [Nocardiopsis tropica]|nr:hypothetical protein [Nocardiopsis tropica]